MSETTGGGIAWAFDIGKKKDEFGKEIYVPSDKYTSLLIAKPERFTFEMKMISEERRAMVEEGWRNVNGGRTEDAEVGIVVGFSGTPELSPDSGL